MVVETVDDADQPLAPGKEGLIRIRGPYNVQGYVGDPGESARAFRNGWFYPGDIGSLTRSNLLIITGRQKTVMNIGGDKVKPELIENVLTSFEGIDEAGAFGFVNDYGTPQSMRKPEDAEFSLESPHKMSERVRSLVSP
jgi:acyl-CoA synthetase (AMP-forming)/AMP-acid ligase II